MKNEIANTIYEYPKAHLNEIGGLFLFVNVIDIDYNLKCDI